MKDYREEDLQPVKSPSKEMIQYYESLFERNQSKFIRRSMLEPSHLGTSFDHMGSQLTLLGSIDEKLMLVRDQNDKYYRLSSSVISKIILGK